MPTSADSREQSGKRTNEWLSAAIGLILIAGISYGLYKGLTTVYTLLAPAPTVNVQPGSPTPAGSVSLSAYFEKSSGQPFALKIAGEVQQDGRPVNEGKVKLTVHKPEGTFRQSTFLNLDQGTFEASPEKVPSFRSIEPGEPLRILAQVWMPGVSDGPLTEELILDVRAPLLAKVVPYLVLFLLVGLSFLFLVVFTGQQSEGKDRVAIAFSYFIAILLLGLSLTAPIVVPLAFPELLVGMERTPVGLLVTHVSEGGESATSAPQWALNIGGSTRRINDASNLSAVNAPNPSIVKVEGGLVIPLYVIILSIIGGAINMTRQLPILQYKGERSAIQVRQTLVLDAPERLGRAVIAVGSRLSGRPSTADPSRAAMEGHGQESGTNPSDPPAARQATSDPPVSAPDSGPPAGDAETSITATDWRTELLNQYMYLIGAPFLAIVTFYLLVWLNLNKVPLVVLVSFSVGLISAPILSRITGIASGLIRPDRPEPTSGGRPTGSTATVSTTVAPGQS